MTHPVPPPLASVLQTDPEPQVAFGRNRGAWTAQLHNIPDVVDALRELGNEVDRHSTTAFVQAKIKDHHFLPAFVATMIWGYGRTGYGPSRVRWVLTGVQGQRSRDAQVRPDLSEKLGSAVTVVREHGPVDAYAHMYGTGRIKYLGGAFFTKWLYYASAVDGPDAASAAPILDKRVAVWLNDNTEMRLRVDRTKSYRQYYQVLGEWADQFGRTRPQVERAIFGLTRQ